MKMAAVDTACTLRDSADRIGAGSKNYGMIGFAWACLGANTLRVVAVIALGIWKAKPAKKEGE